MSQLRVECFTISLDGFGAGLDQSLDNPLGIGGRSLHGWALGTRTFQQRLFGKDEGSTGIDDDFAARGFRNIGAWIMGRNMFGPIRGPWPDESWKGWWGDNPVYHRPVFVLTHHPRASIEMQGGTVFHFVTGGVHEALRLAREVVRKNDRQRGVAVLSQRLQNVQALVIGQMPHRSRRVAALLARHACEVADQLLARHAIETHVEIHHVDRMRGQ